MAQLEVTPPLVTHEPDHHTDFSVPPGLKCLLEEMSREVLRQQPADVNLFLADYLEEKLKICNCWRDGDEDLILQSLVDKHAGDPLNLDRDTLSRGGQKSGGGVGGPYGEFAPDFSNTGTSGLDLKSKVKEYTLDDEGSVEVNVFAPFGLESDGRTPSAPFGLDRNGIPLRALDPSAPFGYHPDGHPVATNDPDAPFGYSRSGNPLTSRDPNALLGYNQNGQPNSSPETVEFCEEHLKYLEERKRIGDRVSQQTKPCDRPSDTQPASQEDASKGTKEMEGDSKEIEFYEYQNRPQTINKEKAGLIGQDSKPPATVQPLDKPRGTSVDTQSNPRPQSQDEGTNVKIAENREKLPPSSAPSDQQRTQTTTATPPTVTPCQPQNKLPCDGNVMFIGSPGASLLLSYDPCSRSNSPPLKPLSNQNLVPPNQSTGGAPTTVPCPPIEGADCSEVIRVAMEGMLTRVLQVMTGIMSQNPCTPLPASAVNGPELKTEGATSNTSKGQPLLAPVVQQHQQGSKLSGGQQEFPFDPTPGSSTHLALPPLVGTGQATYKAKTGSTGPVVKPIPPVNRESQPFQSSQSPDTGSTFVPPPTVVKGQKCSAVENRRSEPNVKQADTGSAQEIRPLSSSMEKRNSEVMTRRPIPDELRPSAPGGNVCGTSQSGPVQNGKSPKCAAYCSKVCAQKCGKNPPPVPPRRNLQSLQLTTTNVNTTLGEYIEGIVSRASDIMKACGNSRQNQTNSGQSSSFTSGKSCGPIPKNETQGSPCSGPLTPQVNKCKCSGPQLPNPSSAPCTKTGLNDLALIGQKLSDLAPHLTQCMESPLSTDEQTTLNLLMTVDSLLSTIQATGLTQMDPVQLCSNQTLTNLTQVSEKLLTGLKEHLERLEGQRSTKGFEGPCADNNKTRVSAEAHEALCLASECLEISVGILKDVTTLFGEMNCDPKLLQQCADTIVRENSKGMENPTLLSDGVGTEKSGYSTAASETEKGQYSSVGNETDRKIVKISGTDPEGQVDGSTSPHGEYLKRFNEDTQTHWAILDKSYGPDTPNNEEEETGNDGFDPTSSSNSKLAAKVGALSGPEKEAQFGTSREAKRSMEGRLSSSHVAGERSLMEFPMDEVKGQARLTGGKGVEQIFASGENRLLPTEGSEGADRSMEADWQRNIGQFMSSQMTSVQNLLSGETPLSEANHGQVIFLTVSFVMGVLVGYAVARSIGLFGLGSTSSEGSPPLMLTGQGKGMKNLAICAAPNVITVDAGSKCPTGTAPCPCPKK